MAVCVIQPVLQVNDLVRAYHHDQPFQFLAAAFTTVAIVAAVTCVIRKRFDPLLVFLALFAHIYAERLRLESHVFLLTGQKSEFVCRLRSALDYLAPMMALAFLEAGGFLGKKGKAVVVTVSLVYFGLIICVLFAGPHRGFDITADWLFIVVLLAISLRTALVRSIDPDASILAVGVLSFALTSIWDKVAGSMTNEFAGLRSSTLRVEPFGVAILLASFGYLTAHRLVHRNQVFTAMQTELELARRVQRSILPVSFPELHSFRVAARYIPMSAVAGDFYDFFEIDSSAAGVLIADVSGHGVPAALIASMVKMAASSQHAHLRGPAELLTGINLALCGNTQNQFVTAAYVYLDARAREFRYAAAGHPAMLLLRKGRVIEVIENGLVLSVSKAATYAQAVHPLELGDRLVLYTDGLVEGRNAQGDLFGETNFYQAVEMTTKLNPTEAAEEIIRCVQLWATRQEDDLTVIVCDFVLPA
jgi:sigma-B regulation protein RsbU (phosphoserine phosphatase)